MILEDSSDAVRLVTVVSKNSLATRILQCFYVCSGKVACSRKSALDITRIILRDPYHLEEEAAKAFAELGTGNKLDLVKTKEFFDSEILGTFREIQSTGTF